MARHDTILISFAFGARRLENISFPAAVDLVEHYLDAERTAFVTLTSQTNDDHWFTSYYADLMGGASPPKEDDWSHPRLTLDRARNYYNSGMDSYATRALLKGVEGFNDVHKKFYDYREALGRGAARAIVTLEVTGMVAGAVFSAGVGLAGASLMTGSLLSAGLTLAEQMAANTSMIGFGLQKKFDVAEIVLQTCASFLSSIISGKLSEYFASVLLRSVLQRTWKIGAPTTIAAVRDVVEWAARNGVMLPKFSTGKEFMAYFVASFGADRLLAVVTGVAHAYQGDLMSMGDFLIQVADKLSSSVSDSLFLKSDVQAASR